MVPVMRLPRALLGPAALLVLALPLSSHAQNPKDAEALKLLEQGKEQLTAGQAVAACETLEKSVKLEPAINTHYQLGRCYEAQSRFATAHTAYLRAATMARTAKDNARFEAAQRAADEIKAKIASIVVVVPPDSDIPGLTVSRDGSALPREDWGKATAVDSGEHEIKVEAPGYEPWSQKVSAEKTGGATTVAVPKLSPLSASDGSSAPPPPVEGAEVDESGWERRSSAVFGLGIAFICVGGAALLGGAIGAGVTSSDAGYGADPGPFIGIGLLGLALLGAGIPLTAVFGARVPPEPEATSEPAPDGESGSPTENAPDAAPAQDAVYVTPLIGPMGGGIRLDF
jgi:hypothetical protein